MHRYSGKKTFMLVKNLTEHSKHYTSNVWHVCGTYRSLSDLNTLIDVGRDPAIIELLESVRCGLGKRSVDQVILTHSHFDHAGLLPKIREKFKPEVYAHPLSRSEKIIPLSDRQKINIGDRACMAVHSPGHSDDSLCILCEEEHLLFSGDVPIRVYSTDGEFPSQFQDAYELFVSAEIKIIYPGHGETVINDVPRLMEESLRNIRQSRII